MQHFVFYAYTFTGAFFLYLSVWRVAYLIVEV